MNSKIIKLGILGAGWISNKAHIPALKKIKNVTVDAICDTNSLKAEETALQHSIPNVYIDINAFLNSDIDAVIIATPNNTHYQLSKLSLEHDKHVLCEKPITIHTSEIEYLNQISAKRKKIFMPAFVNRFRTDIQHVKSIVKNGEIGKIKEIKAGWMRKNGVPRPGSWFTNKDYAGGGVLIDLGSHIIDICLMFLENEQPLKYSVDFSNDKSGIKNSNAKWFEEKNTESLPINIETSMNAKIIYTNDIKMQVELSWMSPINNDYTYFHVKGTKASIYINTLFGFSTNRMYEKDEFLIDNYNKKNNPVMLDLENNDSFTAFVRMLTSFVSSVSNSCQSEILPEDGIKSVKLIEELYKYN